MPRKFGCIGCIGKIFLALVFGCVLFYAAILVTDPWAYHIGGRSTPLLTWRGSGKLLTKSGVEYPLYLYFYPSPHFSKLHREGLRPTGGVQGMGWLCTGRGVTQQLKLSGTIWGGWRSTDNALIAFRLNEPTIFNVGQREGFFDLAGRFHGSALVMDSGTNVPNQFRSGLRIDHASVALDWDSYSHFKSVCASATNLPPINNK